MPFSELRAAKVLNVVMPMVVGDIVDPSNTQAATCSVLSAMLAPADDILGGSASGAVGGLAPAAHDAADELDSDPMRSSLIPSAVGACEWMGELADGADKSAEVQALNAAVRLFSAVFQLGTSDVRKQLLGHLGNAAAKVAQREQKEAGRFSLSGSADKDPSKASGLTNVCGALLGSLQLLASKPSKSALKLDLAGAIDAVVTPCLNDTDAVVRRGAAQCVGLLGGLLGDDYAFKFAQAAEQQLSNPKAKEEARGAYALALGRLLQGAPPNPNQLKATMKLLMPLAADASPLVSEWSLHALLGAVEAASAHAHPHVASCLGLASTVILSDPPPSNRAALVVARLSSALIGALGASGDAVAAMQAGGKPASQLAAAMRRCGVLNSAAVGVCPSLDILVCEQWLCARPPVLPIATSTLPHPPLSTRRALILHLRRRLHRAGTRSGGCSCPRRCCPRRRPRRSARSCR